MKNNISELSLSVIKNWTKDQDSIDELNLIGKLKSSAKKVGEELYVSVLKSYLSMVDDKTDMRHKAILASGLAYFILPIDLIPDMVLGLGFTDDAAALALTIKSVGDAITEKHELDARERWKNF